jgi:hypothetical protein
MKGCEFDGCYKSHQKKMSHKVSWCERLKVESWNQSFVLLMNRLNMRRHAQTTEGCKRSQASPTFTLIKKGVDVNMDQGFYKEKAIK